MRQQSDPGGRFENVDAQFNDAKSRTDVTYKKVMDKIDAILRAMWIIVWIDMTLITVLVIRILGAR